MSARVRNYAFFDSVVKFELEHPVLTAVSTVVFTSLLASYATRLQYCRVESRTLTYSKAAFNKAIPLCVGALVHHNGIVVIV